MLDALKKHALVILAAILFATYRLSRLDGEHRQRGANIEQNFEFTVGFLHQHLDTKYRVLRIASPSHSSTKLLALIVNGEFAIPHVEAEVFVDQHHVLDQRKQKRQKHLNLPPVRFRIYNLDTMMPVAEVDEYFSLTISYCRL